MLFLSIYFFNACRRHWNIMRQVYKDAIQLAGLYEVDCREGNCRSALKWVLGARMGCMGMIYGLLEVLLHI